VREAVLHHQTANLIVLVVDTSGSMGVAERSAAARGAVLSLLVDAYQRRDRVALVAFAGDGASVVLRPTASTEIARARLASLPTGGTTPLAAGIRTALSLAGGQRRDTYRPLLVLVTDGRATWADGDIDPWEDALRAAGEVRRAGVAALVVDCERGRGRLGLAVPLAEALDAPLVGGAGDGLTAEVLAADVRAVLDVRPPTGTSRD
jgi:magnesium chelatase subunit D